MPSVQQIVSEFGEAVTHRFATGGGEPEDLLRAPFEYLLVSLARFCGIVDVVPAGEHHLADERVRPDYAVYVAGALRQVSIPPSRHDEHRIAGRKRRGRASSGSRANLSSQLRPQRVRREGFLFDIKAELLAHAGNSGACRSTACRRCRQSAIRACHSVASGNGCSSSAWWL
jgi:hypothetical protein